MHAILGLTLANSGIAEDRETARRKQRGECRSSIAWVVPVKTEI